MIGRALLVLFALATCLHVSEAQTVTCTASAPSGSLPRPTGIAAGEYELTMVATSGRRSGTMRTGLLHLERSRPEDGKIVDLWTRVERPDTAERPLIGYTLIDLRALGAAFESIEGDADPKPDSRDPTHPGVLVGVSRQRGSDSVTSVGLFISTVHNHRDGSMLLDGLGIALSVLEATDSSFAGRWDNYGLLIGGTGHYCARRVRP